MKKKLSIVLLFAAALIFSLAAMTDFNWVKKDPAIAAELTGTQLVLVSERMMNGATDMGAYGTHATVNIPTGQPIYNTGWTAYDVAFTLRLDGDNTFNDGVLRYSRNGEAWTNLTTVSTAPLIWANITNGNQPSGLAVIRVTGTSVTGIAVGDNYDFRFDVGGDWAYAQGGNKLQDGYNVRVCKDSPGTYTTNKPATTQTASSFMWEFNIGTMPRCGLRSITVTSSDGNSRVLGQPAAGNTYTVADTSVLPTNANHGAVYTYPGYMNYNAMLVITGNGSPTFTVAITDNMGRAFTTAAGGNSIYIISSNNNGRAGQFLDVQLTNYKNGVVQAFNGPSNTLPRANRYSGFTGNGAVYPRYNNHTFNWATSASFYVAAEQALAYTSPTGGASDVRGLWVSRNGATWQYIGSGGGTYNIPENGTYYFRCTSNQGSPSWLFGGPYKVWHLDDDPIYLGVDYTPGTWIPKNYRLELLPSLGKSGMDYITVNSPTGPKPNVRTTTYTVTDRGIHQFRLINGVGTMSALETVTLMMDNATEVKINSIIRTPISGTPINGWLVGGTVKYDIDAECDPPDVPVNYYYSFSKTGPWTLFEEESLSGATLVVDFNVNGELYFKAESVKGSAEVISAMYPEMIVSALDIAVEQEWFNTGGTTEGYRFKVYSPTSDSPYKVWVRTRDYVVTNGPNDNWGGWQDIMETDNNLDWYYVVLASDVGKEFQFELRSTIPGSGLANVLSDIYYVRNDDSVPDVMFSAVYTDRYDKGTDIWASSVTFTLDSSPETLGPSGLVTYYYSTTGTGTPASNPGQWTSLGGGNTLTIGKGGIAGYVGTVYFCAIRGFVLPGEVAAYGPIRDVPVNIDTIAQVVVPPRETAWGHDAISVTLTFNSAGSGFEGGLSELYLTDPNGTVNKINPALLVPVSGQPGCYTYTFDADLADGQTSGTATYFIYGKNAVGVDIVMSSYIINRIDKTVPKFDNAAVEGSIFDGQWANNVLFTLTAKVLGDDGNMFDEDGNLVGAPSGMKFYYQTLDADEYGDPDGDWSAPVLITGSSLLFNWKFDGWIRFYAVSNAGVYSYHTYDSATGKIIPDDYNHTIDMEGDWLDSLPYGGRLRVNPSLTTTTVYVTTKSVTNEFTYAQYKDITLGLTGTPGAGVTVTYYLRPSGGNPDGSDDVLVDGANPASDLYGILDPDQHRAYANGSYNFVAKASDGKEYLMVEPKPVSMIDNNPPKFTADRIVGELDDTQDPGVIVYNGSATVNFDATGLPTPSGRTYFFSRSPDGTTGWTDWDTTSSSASHYVGSSGFFRFYAVSGTGVEWIYDEDYLGAGYYTVIEIKVNNVALTITVAESSATTGYPYVLSLVYNITVTSDVGGAKIYVQEPGKPFPTEITAVTWSFDGSVYTGTASFAINKDNYPGGLSQPYFFSVSVPGGTISAPRIDVDKLDFNIPTFSAAPDGSTTGWNRTAVTFEISPIGTQPLSGATYYYRIAPAGTGLWGTKFLTTDATPDVSTGWVLIGTSVSGWSRLALEGAYDYEFLARSDVFTQGAEVAPQYTYSVYNLRVDTGTIVLEIESVELFRGATKVADLGKTLPTSWTDCDVVVTVIAEYSFSGVYNPDKDPFDEYFQPFYFSGVQPSGVSFVYDYDDYGEFGIIKAVFTFTRDPGSTYQFRVRGGHGGYTESLNIGFTNVIDKTPPVLSVTNTTYNAAKVGDTAVWTGGASVGFTLGVGNLALAPSGAVAVYYWRYIGDATRTGLETGTKVTISTGNAAIDGVWVQLAGNTKAFTLAGEYSVEFLTMSGSGLYSGTEQWWVRIDRVPPTIEGYKVDPSEWTTDTPVWLNVYVTRGESPFTTYNIRIGSTNYALTYIGVQSGGDFDGCEIYRYENINNNGTYRVTFATTGDPVAMDCIVDNIDTLLNPTLIVTAGGTTLWNDTQWRADNVTFTLTATSIPDSGVIYEYRYNIYTLVGGVWTAGSPTTWQGIAGVEGVYTFTLPEGLFTAGRAVYAVIEFRAYAGRYEGFVDASTPISTLSRTLLIDRGFTTGEGFSGSNLGLMPGVGKTDPHLSMTPDDDGYWVTDDLYNLKFALPKLGPQGTTGNGEQVYYAPYILNVYRNSTGGMPILTYNPTTGTVTMSFTEGLPSNWADTWASDPFVRISSKGDYIFELIYSNVKTTVTTFDVQFIDNSPLAYTVAASPNIISSPGWVTTEVAFTFNGLDSPAGYRFWMWDYTLKSGAGDWVEITGAMGGTATYVFGATDDFYYNDYLRFAVSKISSPTARKIPANDTLDGSLEQIGFLVQIDKSTATLIILNKDDHPDNWDPRGWVNHELYIYVKMTPSMSMLMVGFNAAAPFTASGNYTRVTAFSQLDDASKAGWADGLNDAYFENRYIYKFIFIDTIITANETTHNRQSGTFDVSLQPVFGSAIIKNIGFTKGNVIDTTKPELTVTAPGAVNASDHISDLTKWNWVYTEGVTFTLVTKALPSGDPTFKYQYLSMADLAAGRTWDYLGDETNLDNWTVVTSPWNRTIPAQNGNYRFIAVSESGMVSEISNVFHVRIDTTPPEIQTPILYDPATWFVPGGAVTGVMVTFYALHDAAAELKVIWKGNTFVNEARPAGTPTENAREWKYEFKVTENGTYTVTITTIAGSDTVEIVVYWIEDTDKSSFNVVPRVGSTETNTSLTNWTSSDVTFTIEDRLGPASGTSYQYRYRVGNPALIGKTGEWGAWGEWIDIGSAEGYAITATGYWEIEFRAWNRYWEDESDYVYKTVTAYIEKVKPVILDTEPDWVIVDPDLPEWVTIGEGAGDIDHVAVTFYATHHLSGSLNIYRDIGSGAVRQSGYYGDSSVPREIDPDDPTKDKPGSGVWEYVFYARRNGTYTFTVTTTAGTSEESEAVVVGNIDDSRTIGEVNVSAVNQSEEYWTAGNVTFNLSVYGTPPNSGVGGYWYQIREWDPTLNDDKGDWGDWGVYDGTTWKKDGYDDTNLPTSHVFSADFCYLQVRFKVYSRSGLAESGWSDEKTVLIDKFTPTIAVSVTAGGPNVIVDGNEVKATGGWVTEEIKLKLTVTYGPSGRSATTGDRLYFSANNPGASVAHYEWKSYTYDEDNDRWVEVYELTVYFNNPIAGVKYAITARGNNNVTANTITFDVTKLDAYPPKIVIASTTAALHDETAIWVGATGATFFLSVSGTVPSGVVRYEYRKVTVSGGKPVVISGKEWTECASTKTFTLEDDSGFYVFRVINGADVASDSAELESDAALNNEYDYQIWRVDINFSLPTLIAVAPGTTNPVSTAPTNKDVEVRLVADFLSVGTDWNDDDVKFVLEYTGDKVNPDVSLLTPNRIGTSSVWYITFTVSDNAEFRVTALGGAGKTYNTSTPTVDVSVKNIDRNLPILNVTNPTDNAGTSLVSAVWTANDVTFNFSFSNPLSGPVNTTIPVQYQYWNGSAWVNIPGGDYATTMTLTDMSIPAMDGAVHFRVKSAAGNTSNNAEDLSGSHITRYVRIDKGKPLVGIADRPNIWSTDAIYYQNVTVTDNYGASASWENMLSKVYLQRKVGSSWVDVDDGSKSYSVTDLYTFSVTQNGYYRAYAVNAAGGGSFTLAETDSESCKYFWVRHIDNAPIIPTVTSTPDISAEREDGDGSTWSVEVLPWRSGQTSFIITHGVNADLGSSGLIFYYSVNGGPLVRFYSYTRDIGDPGLTAESPFQLSGAPIVVTNYTATGATLRFTSAVSEVGWIDIYAVRASLDPQPTLAGVQSVIATGNAKQLGEFYIRQDNAAPKVEVLSFPPLAAGEWVSDSSYKQDIKVTDNGSKSWGTDDGYGGYSTSRIYIERWNGGAWVLYSSGSYINPQYYAGETYSFLIFENGDYRIYAVNPAGRGGTNGFVDRPANAVSTDSCKYFTVDFMDNAALTSGVIATTTPSPVLIAADPVYGIPADTDIIWRRGSTVFSIYHNINEALLSAGLIFYYSTDGENWIPFYSYSRSRFSENPEKYEGVYIDEANPKFSYTVDFSGGILTFTITGTYGGWLYLCAARASLTGGPDIYGSDDFKATTIRPALALMLGTYYIRQDNSTPIITIVNGTEQPESPAPVPASFAVAAPAAAPPVSTGVWTEDDWVRANSYTLEFKVDTGGSISLDGRNIIVQQWNGNNWNDDSNWINYRLPLGYDKDIETYLFPVFDNAPYHIGGNYRIYITTAAGISSNYVYYLVTFLDPDHALTRASVSTSATSIGMTFTDVDGDGKPDLSVVPWRSGDTVFTVNHGVIDTEYASGLIFFFAQGGDAPLTPFYSYSRELDDTTMKYEGVAYTLSGIFSAEAITGGARLSISDSYNYNGWVYIYALRASLGDDWDNFSDYRYIGRYYVRQDNGSPYVKAVDTGDFDWDTNEFYTQPITVSAVDPAVGGRTSLSWGTKTDTGTYATSTIVLQWWDGAKWVTPDKYESEWKQLYNGTTSYNFKIYENGYYRIFAISPALLGGSGGYTGAPPSGTELDTVGCKYFRVMHLDNATISAKLESNPDNITADPGVDATFDADVIRWRSGSTVFTITHYVIESMYSSGLDFYYSIDGGRTWIRFYAVYRAMGAEKLTATPYSSAGFTVALTADGATLTLSGNHDRFVDFIAVRHSQAITAAYGASFVDDDIAYGLEPVEKNVFRFESFYVRQDNSAPTVSLSFVSEDIEWQTADYIAKFIVTPGASGSWGAYDGEDSYITVQKQAPTGGAWNFYAEVPYNEDDKYSFPIDSNGNYRLIAHNYVGGTSPQNGCPLPVKFMDVLIMDTATVTASPSSAGEAWRTGTVQFTAIAGNSAVIAAGSSGFDFYIAEKTNEADSDPLTWKLLYSYGKNLPSDTSHSVLSGNAIKPFSENFDGTIYIYAVRHSLDLGGTFNKSLNGMNALATDNNAKEAVSYRLRMDNVTKADGFAVMAPTVPPDTWYTSELTLSFTVVNAGISFVGQSASKIVIERRRDDTQPWVIYDELSASLTPSLKVRNNGEYRIIAYNAVRSDTNGGFVEVTTEYTYFTVSCMDMEEVPSVSINSNRNLETAENSTQWVSGTVTFTPGAFQASVENIGVSGLVFYYKLKDGGWTRFYSYSKSAPNVDKYTTLAEAGISANGMFTFPSLVAYQGLVQFRVFRASEVAAAGAGFDASKDVGLIGITIQFWLNLDNVAPEVTLSSNASSINGSDWRDDATVNITIKVGASGSKTNTNTGAEITLTYYDNKPNAWPPSVTIPQSQFPEIAAGVGGIWTKTYTVPTTLLYSNLRSDGTLTFYAYATSPAGLMGASGSVLIDRIDYNVPPVLDPVASANVWGSTGVLDGSGTPPKQPDWLSAASGVVTFRPDAIAYPSSGVWYVMRTKDLTTDAEWSDWVLMSDTLNGRPNQLIFGGELKDWPAGLLHLRKTDGDCYFAIEFGLVPGRNYDGKGDVDEKDVKDIHTFTVAILNQRPVFNPVIDKSGENDTLTPDARRLINLYELTEDYAEGKPAKNYVYVGVDVTFGSVGSYNVGGIIEYRQGVYGDWYGIKNIPLDWDDAKYENIWHYVFDNGDGTFTKLLMIPITETRSVIGADYFGNGTYYFRAVSSSGVASLATYAIDIKNFEISGRENPIVLNATSDYTGGWTAQSEIVYRLSVNEPRASGVRVYYQYVTETQGDPTPFNAATVNISWMPLPGTWVLTNSILELTFTVGIDWYGSVCFVAVAVSDSELEYPSGIVKRTLRRDTSEPNITVTASTVPTEWQAYNANISGTIGGTLYNAGITWIVEFKGDKIAEGEGATFNFTADKYGASGDYIVRAWSAANVPSSRALPLIMIDTIPPEFEVSAASGGEPYSGGWVGTSVTFTFNQTNSTYAPVTFQWSTNGINWNDTSGASTHTFAEAQETRYYFRAVSASWTSTNHTANGDKLTSDIAGTSSNVKDQFWVKIDAGTPQIILVSIDQTWTADNITATVRVVYSTSLTTEGTLYVGATQITGGASQDIAGVRNYVYTVILTNRDDHTLTATGVNGKAATHTIEAKDIFIDRNRPILTVTATFNNSDQIYTGQWLDGTVTYAFDVSYNGGGTWSGYDVYYSTNLTSWYPISGHIGYSVANRTLTLSDTNAEVNRVIYFRAVPRATSATAVLNNPQALYHEYMGVVEGPFEVRIDRLAPKISLIEASVPTGFVSGDDAIFKFEVSYSISGPMNSPNDNGREDGLVIPMGSAAVFANLVNREQINKGEEVWWVYTYKMSASGEAYAFQVMGANGRLSAGEMSFTTNLVDNSNPVMTIETTDGVITGGAVKWLIDDAVFRVGVTNFGPSGFYVEVYRTRGVTTTLVKTLYSLPNELRQELGLSGTNDFSVDGVYFYHVSESNGDTYQFRVYSGLKVVGVGELETNRSNNYRVNIDREPPVISLYEPLPTGWVTGNLTIYIQVLYSISGEHKDGGFAKVSGSGTPDTRYGTIIDEPYGDGRRVVYAYTVQEGEYGFQATGGNGKTSEILQINRENLDFDNYTPTIFVTAPKANTDTETANPYWAADDVVFTIVIGNVGSSGFIIYVYLGEELFKSYDPKNLAAGSELVPVEGELNTFEFTVKSGVRARYEFEVVSVANLGRENEVSPLTKPLFVYIDRGKPTIEWLVPPTSDPVNHAIKAYIKITYSLSGGTAFLLNPEIALLHITFEEYSSINPNHPPLPAGYVSKAGEVIYYCSIGANGTYTFRVEGKNIADNSEMFAELRLLPEDTDIYIGDPTNISASSGGAFINDLEEIRGKPFSANAKIQIANFEDMINDGGTVKVYRNNPDGTQTELDINPTEIGAGTWAYDFTKNGSYRMVVTDKYGNTADFDFFMNKFPWWIVIVGGTVALLLLAYIIYLVVDNRRKRNALLRLIANAGQSDDANQFLLFKKAK
ncbi:MAG: hypothetical protein FWE84_00065 [Firmicutes bacterium]|nr:hypothetical protein [Bacillota bacterium]